MSRSRSAKTRDWSSDSASEYQVSSSSDDADGDLTSDDEADLYELNDGDTGLDAASGDDADPQDATESETPQLDLAAGVEIEPQSSADIAEIEEEIRRFETGSSAEAAPSSVDSDVDGDDALFNGNLHPPEYYQQGIKFLDENEYKKKNYAESTLNALDSILYQFRTYCDHALGRKDWKSCFATINFSMIYYFLEWQLAQKKGRDGRKKREIKSKSYLTVFWCNFRLLFERVMHFKIDKVVDCRLVNNGIAKLNKNLNHNPRVNRPMSISDLKLQIHTTLSTTEKSFKLGELRILAVLFLLLAAPAGSRPTSILKMQFKHIEVLLIRDPENPTGRPRLVTRFTLEFTKSYLGSKVSRPGQVPLSPLYMLSNSHPLTFGLNYIRKAFPIPEILYDPSLLLSPHVFLLAILFQHQAFEAESLNKNPHLLGELNIHGGDKELVLGLRSDIQDKYIFRRFVRTVSGYQLGEQAIELPMMAKWISSVGMLAGFEHSTYAYTLRYMAGNKLDKDVNVSESLRDLVMDHAPHSDTFHKHYLNRNVCADIWAICRDREPQQALLQQATSHGHSVSTRRPVRLTPKEIEDLTKDPEFVRLTKRLEGTNDRSEKHQKIYKKRKAHMEVLKRAKLAQIRKDWSIKQGAIDIERQSRGENIARDNYTRPVQPMNALQESMMQALEAPLINDIAAQLRRRTNAINALVAYCDEEETYIAVTIKTQPSAPVTLDPSLTPRQQMEEIKKSTLTSVVGDWKVVRCFICVASAVSLGKDHPRFTKLCHEYKGQTKLNRHFVRCHLDYLKEEDSFVCPICQLATLHKNHLRNHAHRMHGINTDISFRRPPKKESVSQRRKG